MRREAVGSQAGKVIHLRISNETIKELKAIVAMLQTEHKDREVFVDADEFAVCSAPRPASSEARRTARR